VLLAAGALAIVRLDIAERRATFDASARVAHRLLSQAAAQHDAILATLSLLPPAAGGDDDALLRGLPALHPQVLAVRLLRAPARWDDAGWQAAQARSMAAGAPVLATVDAPAGSYTLLRASPAASVALRIDVRRMVAPEAWPFDAARGVSVTLRHGEQAMVLQRPEAAHTLPAGWTAGFTFDEPLDSSSQPLRLQLREPTGPAQWPWRALAAWAALATAAVAAARALRQLRMERSRSAELARVERVARLDAIGEMAAGLAHELNQPLGAVLASTQAARRLLDDDAPDAPGVRDAVVHAEQQARRMAEVLGRLRRQLQRPDEPRVAVAVDLRQALRSTLDLLAPEVRRLGAQVDVTGSARAVAADPVALQQILHNLVGNALQALAGVPASRRRIDAALSSDDAMARLRLRDSGPGIAADALPRLFEPFFTTRADGLGLGLPLAEKLAQSMGGRLDARNAPEGGAEFMLELPAAKGTQ
jgi:signal transduction histidine kinase